MRDRFAPPRVLERALELLAQATPISDAAFSARLRQEGLSRLHFSARALGEAAEVFGLVFPAVHSQVGEVAFLLRPDDQDAPRRLLHLAGRFVSTRGCINADTLTNHAGDGAELTRAMVEAWLEADGSYAPIDTARLWWWRPERAARGRNRLVNNIRKVLAVSGTISLPDLRTAVRRSHRAHFFAPPTPVLADLCAALDEVEVADGWVRRRPGSDWTAELSPSEQVYVKVLRANGSVMTKHAFAAAAERRGIGPDTLSGATTYSVILWRPVASTYALVGAKLTPGILEQMRTQDPRPAGATLTSQWTGDGRIALTYRLSDAQVRTGVVTGPAAFRDLLGSSYRLSAGGQEAGSTVIRNGGLAGLREALRQLSAEEGDTLLLVLDPRRRTGEAWVGGPEQAPGWCAIAEIDAFLAREAEPALGLDDEAVDDAA